MNVTIHHCALFVVPTMLDAYVSGQLEIQQIKYIFSTGDSQTIR
jgi:long-chain acyl-CoA synthetase